MTGSRGRGPFARPDSDWDVRLIASDDALAEAESLFDTPHGATVEVAVFSLTGFEKAGEIGTDNEWDRYSYAHVEVVLDKLGGRITELVNAKGALPGEVARQIAARQLDAYINAYYRSTKNLDIGLTTAALLDAAESVSPFLSALFAMHERVRPFNKYLAWELEQYPLGDRVWAAAALIPRLQRIVSSGDLAEQQSLFRDSEELARDRGLGEIIDDWAPNVPWLRGERP